MAYRIKLEQFEGPLDLLLALINERKMDVARVSLAAVADQYLEYVKKQENISLENLAHFLSVASRLILIKSRALLPLLEFSQEEEKEIKDLEWQLREFKRFKEVSRRIGNLFDSPRKIFSREGFWGMDGFFYPPENINVFDLKKTFLKIINEIPEVEKLEEEMVREIVTLEEKIDHLREALKGRMESSFSEIVSSANDKIEIIVSFLAMLELIKQRIIHVEQKESFKDIKLTMKNYPNPQNF